KTQLLVARCQKKALYLATVYGVHYARKHFVQFQSALRYIDTDRLMARGNYFSSDERALVIANCSQQQALIDSGTTSKPYWQELLKVYLLDLMGFENLENILGLMPTTGETDNTEEADKE